ncbi:MAG: hypothetical protein SW127_00180 [Actinomycetota bacterium]|nr:hypothetical protein [Actinomycetota bacterium]
MISSSSSTYPVPAVWQIRFSRGDLGAILIYSALGTSSGILAIAAIAAGARLGFASAALVAIGFAIEIFAVLRSVRGRVNPRISSHGLRVRKGALVLVRDPGIRWSEFLAAMTSGSGFVLFAVGVWSESFSIPYGDSADLAIYPPVALVAGTLYLVRALRFARAAEGELEISPNGIRKGVRGGTHTWSAVVQVRPAAIAGDKRGGAWVAMFSDERKEELRVDDACVGATTAFWLLDFYWRHPELRFELSGVQAIKRLCNAATVSNESQHG